MTLPDSASVEPDWTNQHHVQTLVLMGLTAVGLYLCFGMLAPFIPAVVLAWSLAVLLLPMQKILERRLCSPSVAALVCVLAAALIVVIPLSLVGQQVVMQVIKSASGIEERIASGTWQQMLASQPVLAPLADTLERHFDLPGAAKSITTWLGTFTGSFLRGSVLQVVGFLLAFYLLFYFLRDRELVLKCLRSLSPLTPHEMDHLYQRVGDTLHATLYGTLAVSVTQGVLGGLMFWCLGLPGPLLWGAVMGTLSIIPVLGAFVIWIPAVLFLLFEGEWQKALILSAWGMLVVGTVDNLLRPYLVGRRLKLHTVLAFLSVLGGLALIGPAGLILGPVILTVTMVLLETWRARTALDAQTGQRHRRESDVQAAE